MATLGVYVDGSLVLPSATLDYGDGVLGVVPIINLTPQVATGDVPVATWGIPTQSVVMTWDVVLWQRTA